MKVALVVIAAVSMSSLWQAITRPTNSQAASARGVSAFERQQYSRAVAEFKSAASSGATAQNIFNLGTAQIAAGERAEGSATLAAAMKEPALRARSLYNRGNSALAANAYDHAIRDYTESLKLAPEDREAKRNLEIALQRRESQQQRQQAGGQNQQQQSPGAHDTPQPAPDQGRQEEGQADAEALLRSVQQQEQEELARMKRARGSSARVGW
jgi:tetratricopeptide (TPR) repeat protein